MIGTRLTEFDIGHLDKAVRDQVMGDNLDFDANDALRYLATLGAKHYKAGSRLTPDELDGPELHERRYSVDCNFPNGSPSKQTC